MVSGNEQSKLDPQSPKTGSANLVTDPKNKSEKQANNTKPKTLTHEEVKIALGIETSKVFSGIA